jgi:MFS family permease
MAAEPRLGIRPNLRQFSLLVVVNAFVGAMVGQERSLLPLVAERDFGIASAAAAGSFLVSFGLVKAVANLAAGGLSDRFGRRGVLLAGWLIGIPVPFALAFAPAWGWIVAANALLGVNQGLAWSTTVVMKVDLAGPERRGLATGLNEFSGYLAVGVSAFGTAALAQRLGDLRPWPFLLGVGIAGIGLVLSAFTRETYPHAVGEARSAGLADRATVAQAFARSSWRDARLAACSQAGLVNNANDAAVWALFPLLAGAAGLGVGRLGVVAAVYPATWGLAQLVTGPASDRMGRRPLIVGGLVVQAGALVLFAAATGFGPWVAAAVILGLGTALVYPTLLAAVADYSAPLWRGAAIGGYRFWRDAGYAAGGLAAGLLADAFGFRWAIAALGLVTAASGLVARVLLPAGVLPAGSRHAIGTG